MIISYPPHITGRWRGVLGIALIVCFAALADTAPASASPPPALFETETGEPLSIDRLATDLADRRFVLLGEKHDNPEHHDIQADILRRMIAAGRKPALVWEMIERGKQPEIDSFVEAEDTDPDAFADAVGWAESGWPDWKFYRPIAELALTAGLPMVAGNLDADTVRAISRGDMTNTDLRAALRLDEAVPESVRDALLDEVYRGHCGLIPRTKLSPMVAVQIARDASLAEAMVRSAAMADGAVLIAGGQHARRDTGAGYHLEQRFGGKNIVSIGLLEGDLEIVWAGEEHAIPASRFDYVWYTDPAHPKKDYCADLKARFSNFTKD
ncbi:ChaN family lipoprotein [Nisaea nitritireducens]|uniref:ChaN family lipoprotein n=1 Tax=Nisaea nitritireducens TaxID=568392 RepID=UPI0018685627|nr:ChaN family lipoprotein [Nisaea nitritireducens]